MNSVHGQAIDRLRPGWWSRRRAPDGTIEAVAMPSAPGWLLGVQWHPEWALPTTRTALPFSALSAMPVGNGVAA